MQKDGLAEIYLKPGEHYFGDKPTVVKTVLGSCISIVMFSPRKRIGGICHALLPEGECSDDDARWRYVNCSLLAMIEMFRERGVLPGELEVKAFGGADMLSVSSGSSDTIGRKNIRTALKTVEILGLRLVACNLGGTRGRKLLFYTHTGEVLLMRGKETGSETAP